MKYSYDCPTREKLSEEESEKRREKEKLAMIKIANRNSRLKTEKKSKEEIVNVIKEEIIETFKETALNTYKNKELNLLKGTEMSVIIYDDAKPKRTMKLIPCPLNLKEEQRERKRAKPYSGRP